MDDGLRYFEIPLPTGGIATSTVDFVMPDNKAPLLTNFLLDRPGRLVPRGRLAFYADMSTDLGTNRPFGSKGWVFNKRAIAGVHDDDAGFYFQYWKKEMISGDSGVNAANGSTTVLGRGDAAAPPNINFTLASALLAPGLKGVRMGSFVYGPAYAGTGLFTGPGGEDRLLLKWDGVNTITSIASTAAPAGVMDVAEHYNRLWALGGAQPSGFAWNGNVLYFTNVGGPSTVPAVTDWQTSGLTNQLPVGTDAGANDYGLALAHVGSDLLILKRRSIWILKGNTTDTFTVKPVSTRVGCIDPRSVVEYNDAVYWMSDNGFWRYDGAQLENLSEDINVGGAIHQGLVKQMADLNVDFTGGYVAASHIGSGYFLVSLGTMKRRPSDSDTFKAAYLFDSNRRTWVNFSALVPDKNQQPWFAMEVASISSDHEVIFVGPTTWYGGGNVVRPELQTGSTKMIDTYVGGASSIFPTTWISKAFPLSSPGFKAQLHRASVDHVYTVASAPASPNDVAWKFKISTDNEEGFPPTDALFDVSAAGTGPVPSLERRLYHAELFTESVDVFVTIDNNWGLANPATWNTSLAEIRRVMIAWQETHRRV